MNSLYRNQSVFSRSYTALLPKIRRHEKSIEIDVNGNSLTAEFWQYDARIARRWNFDPKPGYSLSPYSTFKNNPLIYNDPFGDTTRYYNIADGTWLGQINNPGDVRNVKITVGRYTAATNEATGDP